jgi:hypothetical protein
MCALGRGYSPEYNIPNTAMAQESERETVEITSIVNEQLGSPATHRRDSSALEATELSRIRRQYSRVSSSHHTASFTVSRRSTSLNGWAKIKYTMSKFWKNQISVIVDHDACRDHLGMHWFLSVFVRLVLDSRLGLLNVTSREASHAISLVLFCLLLLRGISTSYLVAWSVKVPYLWVDGNSILSNF